MLKYLGIDWGEKRIGLALGDDETKIASPFKVVNNMDEILPIIKKESIDAVVLGVPYQITNYKLPISDNFESFKKLLNDKLNIPISYIDERLTSKAADALIGDKKTKAPRDSVSAMIILQSYFDTK
jgi:putative Holliday junction resolvase